jgi:predicted DNA-binding protein (UPF0251 family)
MPRPKLIRRMNNPPHFKGFRPIGVTDGSNTIVLNFEEYEAIRLSDFELYGQVEAARLMGISRPTYSRIYESARRKVAQALVQGFAIVFEGGKVYFDSEWYSCNSCSCWFNHPAKELVVVNCALCGSNKIVQFKGNTQIDQLKDICICPHCGFETEHIAGLSCRKESCPECDHTMIRKMLVSDPGNSNRNCKH